MDGKDVVGEVNRVLTGDNDGGDPPLSTTNDQFTSVVLSLPDSTGVNYNFGERVEGGDLHEGQAANIGFWQNKHGQGLIMSLNGDTDSTLLGTWLSETFPNMYGSLAGMNNEQVAAVCKELFKRNGKTSPGGPPKLDAQVLGVALATYATKRSLAGLEYVDQSPANVDFLFEDNPDAGIPNFYEPEFGDVPVIRDDFVADIESYGFDVTTGGVGATFFNIGDSGEAFDAFEDDDRAQIIDLLLATDRMSFDGLLYDDNDDGDIDGAEELLRRLAHDVYSAINQAGGQ